MINFFKYTVPIIIFIKAIFASSISTASEEKIIYMVLETGVVKIETYSKFAPKTVKRIIELSDQGFYDGLTFHRVIKGFMAQGGDPDGNGRGGSGKNIKAEFNELKHERGIVSMARASDPDSADSQFFICFKPAPFLDRQYTVFGKVIEGMEIVDKIKRGDENNNGSVSDPDKIISFKSL